jgi:hypothetical protein
MFLNHKELTQKGYLKKLNKKEIQKIEGRKEEELLEIKEKPTDQ